MGEVYRARDTKLNRDVALKVLPDAFVHDADRLARFQREAHVLASLNHPNIAHIHGLEDAGGVRALVLELVEGPTLADRIARALMPLPETLAVAKQIADALEVAHEQGVIHRDLKPANIKVKDDGTVKVLDFGLAKALDPTAVSGSQAAEMMQSPTMTARGTEMGLILGTAAYMSPEQAKGKAADRRADIWAFGVVLFEMVTGKQVFTGETASEVMASVMKEQPDWSRLPANLPAPLARLLRRCLEKDPKKRLSSIADARLELDELDGPASPAPSLRARLSLVWLGAAGLAGAVVAIAAWLLIAPANRAAGDPTPMRVSILSPDGVTLAFDSAESAISPDGRQVAFTTTDPSGTSRLSVRSISDMTARPIAGTENAYLPFWSPDGQEIAFFTAGKLNKVPVQGGTVEVLCEAKDGRGGTWNAAGVIVFAPTNGGPLQRVSANGGDPHAVTTLDAAKGEAGHRFPWFLPDGQHFLFAALPAKDGKFDLYVGSLDSPARQAVGSAESAAVYADPGYLLYARKNSLVAQRFDARTLQASGEPVTIGDAPSSIGSVLRSESGCDGIGYRSAGVPRRPSSGYAPGLAGPVRPDARIRGRSGRAIQRDRARARRPACGDRASRHAAGNRHLDCGPRARWGDPVHVRSVGELPCRVVTRQQPRGVCQ